MTLRRRTKVIIVLTVVVVVGVWIFVPNNKARRKAERMQRELRAEGFKTEVSEFNLAVSPEVRQRVGALITAGRAASDVIPNRGTGFFQPVGSNAAIVLAKEEKLAMESSADHWPVFRTALEIHKAELDAACEGLMAGPIRFEPAQGPGGDLVVGYVMEMRSLSAALAARSLLELHDQHPAEAWTNLLALTRLTTAWNTEPVEFAYSIKFYCATMAARVTWEAAQMHALKKEEIARLSKEWAGLDVFKGLPETAELSCAFVLQACETERQRPAGPGVSMRQILGDLFDSPGRGWSELTAGSRDARYRNYGAYEDETAAMAFYRGRERGLKEMAKGMRWAEARSLEGMTNQPGSDKGGTSRLASLINQPTLGGAPRAGSLRFRSLPARAAETEVRRRLVCTGLALEHFYLSHGTYPKSLSDLAPEFVAPADFMDGKPLRYESMGESNFVMYSTGLDCVDNGGIMKWETNQGFGRGFYRGEEPDMLWPRAATAEEVEREKRIRELARREGGGGGGGEGNPGRSRVSPVSH